MLITVCNNIACKNRQNPCRAGCLQKGWADYCAGCESTVCPWGPDYDYVPIPIIICKKGGSS